MNNKNNLKISQTEILISIFSNEIDKGKYMVHLDTLYKTVWNLREMPFIHFEISDETIPGYPGVIKYKRNIRAHLSSGQKRKRGEDWIFEKASPDILDGWWKLNPKKAILDSKIDALEVTRVKEISDKPVLERANVLIRNSYEQYRWSNKIKRIWGKECIFCNALTEEIIVSAHISDDKEKSSEFYSKNNGLPSCRNCHELFDRQKIILNENLRMYVSDELKYIDINDKINKTIPGELNLIKIKENILKRNSKYEQIQKKFSYV